MNKAIRQVKILRVLNEQKKLTVDDIKLKFKISSATVRRDFADLARSGAVKRISGGIIEVPPTPDNILPIALRKKWNLAEKDALCKTLSKQIPKDSVLLVDGGSTTLRLALWLEDPTLTVITNSLPLANTYSERFPWGGGPSIILTGGRLDAKSGLLLGPNAEESIRLYRADFFISSARGITTDGVFNNHDSLAGVERAMHRSSKKTIIIADGDKIGKESHCLVFDLAHIDLLITNENDENKKILKEISKQIKTFSI